MTMLLRVKEVLMRFKYLIGAVIVVGGFIMFGGDGEAIGATLTVSRGDFSQQVSVSGSVVAAKDVELGFASSGRIAGIYARVGQRVGAGAVLAEIENGDLSASLSQKRFALKEAEAKLASLRVGTRSEELAVASAEVANAEASLMDAVRSAYTTADDAIHNKVDSLFTNPRTDAKLSFNTSNTTLKLAVEMHRGEIETLLTDWGTSLPGLSKANVQHSASAAQAHLTRITAFLAEVNAAINQGVPDQTTTSTVFATYATTLATARANIQSTTASLTSAQSSYTNADANYKLKAAGATAEDIAAQEAMVAGAEAEVQSALSALVKTRVVAPFTGVVTKMDAKVGEIVSPTASLIGMQSDGVFQIETYIPEVAITRISVGNPATTTLDAYGGGVVFAATVISIDPAETIKDGVPAYKTTISFTEADPRIRSGMTANVIIETGLLTDAIVIPAGAVGTKNSKQYVSVVQGEEVTERAVTIGVAPALGQAHILSGLSAEEVILLAPVK